MKTMQDESPVHHLWVTRCKWCIDLWLRWQSGAAARLRRSIAQAVAFQRMSRTPWRDIVREGMAMKRSHELSWTQVIMAANTPMMLRASMVDGRTDLGTLASGQVAGVIDDLPSCAELVERIMTQAGDVLDRLASAGIS